MITDHLGSVRVVYDGSGAILSSKDYLPFGDTLSSTGRAAHRRWIGCERDAESETGEHGMRRR